MLTGKAIILGASCCVHLVTKTAKMATWR